MRQEKIHILLLSIMGFSLYKYNALTTFPTPTPHTKSYLTSIVAVSPFACYNLVCSDRPSGPILKIKMLILSQYIKSQRGFL